MADRGNLTEKWNLELTSPDKAVFYAVRPVPEFTVIERTLVKWDELSDKEKLPDAAKDVCN